MERAEGAQEQALQTAEDAVQDEDRTEAGRPEMRIADESAANPTAPSGKAAQGGPKRKLPLLAEPSTAASQLRTAVDDSMAETADSAEKVDSTVDAFAG